MVLQSRPSGPLRGAIHVPGDKSISHRAVMFGAIARGTSWIHGFLPANDCQATIECMRALGATIETHSPTELSVQGVGLRGLQEPEDVLDCGGSGTTMRLLTGLLAGQGFFSVLTGNESLRRRPMDRVAIPLREMGATVLGRDRDRRPPLAVRGGNLQGIDYPLPVASAQVKSAILLAGLYADGPTVVRQPAPARDHTERLLKAQGALLQRDGLVVTIAPPEEDLFPLNITIPGDFSSAAFLLVAACLVPGSEITVEGVGVNETRTGLLDVLLEMGADIRIERRRESSGEPLADVTACYSPDLHAVEVGGDLVPRAIDEFPLIALLATQASGKTTVRDAAELRVKESDRIAAVARELHRLGARVEEHDDGFSISGPVRLQGTFVDSHDDHRLAMMLAVAGLIAAGETQVAGAKCIADSFPGFWATINSLRESPGLA
jgi:3-phosphoshikimate 1-carboxyvinyltransferase